WLWVVALLALAAIPGWLAGAASVIALADYASSFARLHLQADRAFAQAAWFDGAIFWPTVCLRDAAPAACALWAFTHMLRKSDGAAGSPIKVWMSESQATPAFGRYRDPVMLGAGGMGAVYRATDPSLHRYVAIKVLTQRDPRYV